MAIEVPQNEEISGRMEGEKESVPPSVGGENRGAYTLMTARSCLKRC